MCQDDVLFTRGLREWKEISVNFTHSLERRQMSTGESPGELVLSIPQPHDTIPSVVLWRDFDVVKKHQSVRRATFMGGRFPSRQRDAFPSKYGFTAVRQKSRILTLTAGS